MSAMVTPDGRWRVEVVQLDGTPEYRVTEYGYLARGRGPRFNDRGRYIDLTVLARDMGHAFATLQETRN